MAKTFKMELLILLFGCCLLQPLVAGDALGPSSELQVEGYTHRTGDCVGNDIRRITRTTVANCARECNALESCKAFVYNSRSFSGRYCWLKSSECPRLTWETTSHYHFYTKKVPVVNATTTSYSVSDCLNSFNCWVKFNFTAPSTWNDCAGGAKYVKKTNYSEGRFLGVELCSPTKYKLFLANNLTSEYQHIADGAGIGNDHCEFIGDKLDNAGRASKEGAEHAPDAIGFRRSHWGAPLVHGKIGRANGHWYYPKSYTCGVTVPGSDRVVEYHGSASETFVTSITTPATTVVSNTTFTLVAPRITLAPRDQKAKDGSTVSFVCQASGSPVPDIVWLKNEQRVTTRGRYGIHDMPFGSVLRIEPVKAETDDATISCVAQNGFGVPAKKPANLQVYPRGQAPSGFPTIITNPLVEVVEKDRTAIMVCGATGNPAPTIKWLKDYRPVDLSDPRLTLLSSGPLQIQKTQETDEGRYECLAENDVGVTYSYAASLYVRAPPYFTTLPENTEVLLGGSVNLTCIAAGSPEPYVMWRKGAEELSPEDSIQIKENVLMLTNVREPADYTCIATNVLGRTSTVAQVKVKDEVPLAVVNATETSPSVSDCLNSTNCWVRYNFSAPSTWNDCAGGAKYVKKTNYSEGRFLGVELCSPTKYKLFLANNLTSEYQHIADGAGIGDDHCEFIGGDKNNARASKEGAELAPDAIGFRRSHWGTHLVHGKIGRANGHWYYPKSYTCGVTVPGSDRVAEYHGSASETFVTSSTTPATTVVSNTTSTLDEVPVETSYSVSDCLNSTNCWVKLNFTAPSTWNDCAGGAKYVKKTNYSEGRFLGVELCSPTKYKLFLANNLTSEYQHIADGAGIGDDHCEFMGGKVGNARASKEGAEYAPSAIGFRRSYWGKTLVHGKIGRENGYWYYPKSYTCGVTVPGSHRVAEYHGSPGETFVTPTTTPTSPMVTQSTTTPAPDFNNLEGYSHRNGDCPGYDIQRVARTTVDVCAEKCREMTRCKSFMFYDRGILSYCWLKYNECGTLSRTSERNLHFYNKVSQTPTLPSSELPEALASCSMKKVESATIRDVGMSAVPVSSEGQCGDKCRLNTTCDSAIFDKDNNKCLLHLRRGFILPRLSRDSCCTTYKKVCPLIKSPVPPPKVQILCPLGQGTRKPSDKYAYKVLRLKDNFERGEYSCRTDELCAGLSFEVWNGERVDFTFYYNTTPEPGAPYFNSTGIKNCTLSGPPCKHVKAVFGKTLTNIRPYRRETTVETKAECLVFCERDQGGCSAATYRQKDKECWLYRFPKKDFEYQLEPSDGRVTTWIKDPEMCATRSVE